MAKFYMEDGTNKSGDRIVRESMTSTTEPKEDFALRILRDIFENSPKSNMIPRVPKMKIPHGKNNSQRLLNTCPYDLLCHIQESLTVFNRCIISMITNEPRRCLPINDNLRNRINAFAAAFITDDLKKEFPQHPDETDDGYYNKLCHIAMHRYQPSKLQSIRCEECISNWLHSSEW